MKRGFLSEYFVGAVAKRLAAVEIDPARSNQHELNGVAALKELLGPERLSGHPARFAWIDDDESILAENSTVTWYDARENHPTRSEFRLYFPDNPVMRQACAGDLLIVARQSDSQLLVIIAQRGSTIENQLCWLFGIPEQIGIEFKGQLFAGAKDIETGFAARFILDELGIETTRPYSDNLDDIVEQFGDSFPTTAVFSRLARNTLPQADPREAPDETLMAWVEREELLFRTLERKVVERRLKEGFWGDTGPDVDGFLQFSLSVQNRRKSRAGHALENHLEEIFRCFDIQYTRGAVTENQSKPDFLFPSVKAYHSSSFPESWLTMLGVKSTCKDRWRQVLSEAARIPEKHLLTLEPGISENQTTEMQHNSLQLVVPKPLHVTYKYEQFSFLLGVMEFLNLVQERQAPHSQAK